MNAMKYLSLPCVLLLCGCLTTTDVMDTSGNLRNGTVFQFEGETWEISYKKDEKEGFFSEGTLAVLKRQSRPLQVEQADQSASLRAADYYMKSQVICQPGKRAGITTYSMMLNGKFTWKPGPADAVGIAFSCYS